MVIALIGPSGAGKTIKMRKAKELIPDIISIPFKSLLETYRQDITELSDKKSISIVKKHIDSSKAKFVVIDGAPETTKQAKLFEEMGVKFDRIVYLSISEDEAFKRIQNRLVCSNLSCKRIYSKERPYHPQNELVCDKCKSLLIKREEDESGAANERLKKFYEEIQDLLKWYKAKNVPIIEVGPEEHICSFLNALTN